MLLIDLGGNVQQCPPGQDTGNSQARDASNQGCAPGFVPVGCDTTQRLNGSIAGSSTEIIEFGPMQSLQFVAMVDIGTGVNILLNSIEVNEEQMRTKFRPSQGPAFLVSGFGAVTAFTSAVIEAGANWVPAAVWLCDQNNPIKFEFENTAVGAEDLDVWAYFANPGSSNVIARKNGDG